MIFKKKLRYILVETSDTINLNSPQVVDALKKGAMSFLGQLPYFKANPQVATQLGNNVFIVSANRGYEKNVILALSFVKSLDGRKIGFYTVKTSGTIRSLKEYFWKSYGH